MKRFIYFCLTVVFIFLLPFSVACQTMDKSETGGRFPDTPPHFTVDPFWPKPLPNNWLIGDVAGVAVDSKDHVWIIHRPDTIRAEPMADKEPNAEISYVAAPPVIEFDQEGNVVQAWGGPGEGYDWPKTEHGLFIDDENNVWVGSGSMQGDDQVLKFKSDGTFLLQIGKAGKTGGSNDKTLLGVPPNMEVDPDANEVYVADGYLNLRVVVFDADTGEYKRSWGAYGEPPVDTPLIKYNPDEPPSKYFNRPVHALAISHDGLVYVCDRQNNRLQVFKKDGTFVKEVIIAKHTKGFGSVWDVDFSQDPDQTYLYVLDGRNGRVWILRRKDLEIVDHFGRIGRNAGQFHWVHSLAVDSKGNIYTGEVDDAMRVQKFVFDANQ